MNPLIAALLAAGVISQDEARIMNGMLSEGATRIEAEQRIAAAFAQGLENQRARLISALDRGNIDYRDPLLPDFWRTEHELLARDVLPTLTGVAQEVALTATVRGGGLAQWRTVNEAVTIWTDTHYRLANIQTPGSMEQLDNTARNRVADAIVRWQRGELNEDAGPGGLPRLIAELQRSNAWDVERAAEIAVTETTHIYATAKLEAALANPLMVWLEWITSADEMVCNICAPLNGVRIRKEQRVFPGGYFPAAHARCRCGVESITEYAGEFA
jgi:SPP1 gp7 family putative phage head morphogenesis protein